MTMTKRRNYSFAFYSIILIVLSIKVNVISGFTSVPSPTQQTQRQRQRQSLHITHYAHSQKKSPHLEEEEEEENKKSAASKKCPFLRTLASTAGEATASAAQSKLQPVSTTSSTLSTRTTSITQSTFTKLNDLYTQSSKLKCPFWRRRAADTIDSIAMTLRFLLVRHKSLGIFDPFLLLGEDEFIKDDGTTSSRNNIGLLLERVEQKEGSVVPGCKPLGFHVTTNTDGTIQKHRHLDIVTISTIIQKDWTDALGRNKGYYITGRLNSTIYRDDCLFDGPDPDMPVRGLRKYLSAASHLFDGKRSFAQLLSLTYEERGGVKDRGYVEVRWRLGGVLMLPWRPVIKPWTGTTRYHVNEEGLICFHEEMWDISVLEAFVCTVWPEVGERIWGPFPPGGESGDGGTTTTVI